MTKPPLDDDNANGAGDPPSSATSTGGNAPFGFSGWMKDGAPSALHPLMQQSTASVAAAAAMGFGMASHLTGFMLGAMQGFVEATQKSKQAAESRPQPDGEDAAPPPAGEAADEPAAASTDIGADAGIAAEAPASDMADAVPVKAPKIARITKSARATPPAAGIDTSPEDPIRKGVRSRRTKVADDLKRISGIGPKLEQMLNGMGIMRYAQIAGWDEAETARFDEALNVSGRIARDRWCEQAKALMKA